MNYSYFYDNDPWGFPQDTQHFYNVLVICIAVPPENAEELFPEGVIDIWYLDELTSPRPRAIHFYIDEDFSYLDADEEDWDDEEEYKDWMDDMDDEYWDDVDYGIDYFPHSVVEIYNGNQVCFYQMLDFDTPDFWEITR